MPVLFSPPSHPHLEPGDQTMHSAKTPESRAAARPTVWIVAPSPPPYGGMSIQAKKLCQRLASKGLRVEFITTNPAIPGMVKFSGRVPALRTFVREFQYLASLTRILRNPGVIHHFSASYLFFFFHSAPLFLLSKFSPSS